MLTRKSTPNQTTTDTVKTAIENHTYKTIPPFYQMLPKSADSIGQKLREEARTVFLQKRSRELLDNNELKVLWTLLEANYTMPIMNAEKFISYDDYGTMRNLAGPKCRSVTSRFYVRQNSRMIMWFWGYRHYLTASVFARLQSVSGYPGRVSIMSLFNYVMRKVWLQQTRIGLSLHDSTGQGYLRESVIDI